VQRPSLITVQNYKIKEDPILEIPKIKLTRESTRSLMEEDTIKEESIKK
jgi:hypothetical protein